MLKPTKLILIALGIIVASCSLEKKSGFNRGLQNLTAHYNILFNAKELLRQKQESYATTYVDNYNQILSVYQDTIAKPASPDKDLELAITKANTIINIKEQSKYIGDAYLVLGKAYFLEGNYFNGEEYFNYVIQNYPARTDLVQEALTWKARSSMYLNELPQAKASLDTAIQIINPKKRSPADVYAAKLQYDINVQDYVDGEEMAKKAVEYGNNKMQRLRWTFILGQLQELNQKNAAAFASYTKVANSNVAFEMAFNASLNRIRMQDNQNGIKVSRQDRLLSLLKDPNNVDFKDQIYYNVAEIYLTNKDIDNAIKNYKLSVRSSTKNQNQKGLSYLRLAQINFKNKGDYISAKKYYDSTLTSLAPNYPGYQGILKISSNLQLLADRMQIIIREDTLQALAKMDEATRSKIIDKMVNDRILQQQAAQNNAATATTSAGTNVSGNSNNSTFYFYNTAALSQGYTDFKKRWGNRKLEDNWRRSSRASSDITNSNSTNIQGTDPDAPVGTDAGVSKTKATASNYRQELIQGLPLTPELLAQSNLRLYNAYVDVANFYRDILNDKKEAIAGYELILRLFPNDPNKAATYYNLYRLYSESDPARSELYKNLLIKEFPETPFARVIIDPDYVKKLGDKDAAFTAAYNQVFDSYLHKKYNEVITTVPKVLQQYPGNKFASQLYYLKTVAEGHSERAGPFRDSLQKVAQRFPDDKLVTPLINEHLAYISANSAEILNRDVVLADNDPRDIPFTLDNALKEETAYRRPFTADNSSPQPVVKAPEKKQLAEAKPQPVVTAPAKPAEKIPEQAKTASPPAAVPTTQTATIVQPPANNTAVTPPPVSPALTATSQTTPVPATQATNQPVVKAPDVVSVFTMQDSTNYFFVVNVTSGTTNVSSSRFGIGQFDRVNFAGKGIRHQLMQVGADNQLIYVGRFPTIDGVKKYASLIIPLLPDIMKVGKDKYSFFIITQENLNKLADKKLLDSYIDYYQKNYLQ